MVVREFLKDSWSSLLLKPVRMVSFVVSVAITCFDVRGVTQRVVTGAVWFVVVMFVGWTAATGWMDSRSSRELRKHTSKRSATIRIQMSSTAIAVDDLEGGRTDLTFKS